MNNFTHRNTSCFALLQHQHRVVLYRRCSCLKCYCTLLQTPVLFSFLFWTISSLQYTICTFISSYLRHDFYSASKYLRIFFYSLACPPSSFSVSYTCNPFSRPCRSYAFVRPPNSNTFKFVQQRYFDQLRLPCI